jgi:hypothetical protein
MTSTISLLEYRRSGWMFINARLRCNTLTLEGMSWGTVRGHRSFCTTWFRSLRRTQQRRPWFQLFHVDGLLWVHGVFEDSFIGVRKKPGTVNVFRNRIHHWADATLVDTWAPRGTEVCRHPMPFPRLIGKPWRACAPIAHVSCMFPASHVPARAHPITH